MTIAAQKTALRADLAARRDAAYAAYPAAGDRLAARFPAALIPPTGSVVSGYFRFRSEIDPSSLLARLGAAACRLALPRTPARQKPGEGLSFHLWAPGDPLVRSPFGVLEPVQDAPTIAPDLILAPLLGFDRAGGRIGYGQGHYDRTLAALRALKSVTVVGVGFAVQEVATVPSEPTDQQLDWMVTDQEVIGPFTGAA